MKKLTVAALAVTTLLSGSAFAHEAGEFFMRAGSATVRPTEGAGGTLGSLGGFSVTNKHSTGLDVYLYGDRQHWCGITGSDAVPP